MEFHVEQLFNRRSIGFLWDKRAILDPGQVALITSIYKNIKKGDIQPTQKITYKLSRTAAGKLGYGRLYGNKGSFETLEKECRGTICGEYYHDLDINNCHPVLLAQFIESNHPDFSTLKNVKHYIDNREKVLADYMEENNCSRDDAKQAVISVMYGSIPNKNSIIYPLSREVRNIAKQLYALPEYEPLANACKNEKNQYGSFLSYLLQTEERKCMLAMRTSLMSMGWSVDVFCYDGIMIRQRADAVCDDALLQKCESEVSKTTSYDINLTLKPFASFEVPVSKDEVVPGVNDNDYQTMKQDFELNHAYHIPSDMYVEIGDDSTLQFMSEIHAKRALQCGQWLFRHSKKFADYTTFFSIWVKDDKLKSCKHFSFKDSSDNDVMMIPISFAYKKATPPPVPTTAVPMFLELIDLITNHDSILSQYVINWTAHLLQQPTDLPGVALIFTGEKGVGKDTFGDFLQEYIVGEKLSTNYTTNKQFFGTHDTGKLNKFLIKLEETSKKECFENASELKANITAIRLTANPKGVGAITADNFARFIFTTNKPNPVDLSDDERRFVLLCCSNKRKGDHEFWKLIRKTLFNREGGAEVAKYLLDLDISEFNVRQLPKNDYQQSVVVSEQSSEQRFVAEWDGKKVRASELYELYKEFCSGLSIPHAANAAWFARNLQAFVRNSSVVNTQKDGVSYYAKP